VPSSQRRNSARVIGLIAGSATVDLCSPGVRFMYWGPWRAARLRHRRADGRRPNLGRTSREAGTSWRHHPADGAASSGSNLRRVDQTAGRPVG
jgi:hypothetical protein